MRAPAPGRIDGGTYYLHKGQQDGSPGYTVTWGSPEAEPLGSARTRIGARRVIDKDVRRRLGSTPGAEIAFEVEEVRRPWSDWHWN